MLNEIKENVINEIMNLTEVEIELVIMLLSKQDSFDTVECAS